MHLLSPHAYSREYRWRRWVAVLAAYALALQALLGQLSASVHASTGRADAGWLCAPDQGQAPGPIPNPASPRAEFCCALACHPSGTDCAVESLPASRLSTSALKRDWTRYVRLISPRLACCPSAPVLRRSRVDRHAL